MMDATRKKLVVLELYSGIGGMHFALKESGIPFDVVAAFDINHISNSIYHHNFPQTKLRAKCLSTLTLSELETYSADLVTMSPPCQPFTRVGKQRDVADERTKSLLHFLDLLPKLSKIPDYILLENVKGFEISLTRDVTVKCLEKLNFTFQEFLLTPLQFSIPNSRLRYYLLAKRSPLTFNFKTQSDILKTMPSLTTEPTAAADDGSLQWEDSSRPQTERLHSNESSISSQSSSTSQNRDTSASTFHTSHNSGSGHDSSKRRSSPSSKEVTCVAAEGEAVAHHPVAHQPLAHHPLAHRLLSEYLENQPDEYFERYLLPRKFYRYFWVMDLTQRKSSISCCFTKRSKLLDRVAQKKSGQLSDIQYSRYGHHIEGAGSVIQMKTSLRDLTEFRSSGMMTEECAKEVEALQLRFFTPREIANLLCFPPQFDFPHNVTTLQLYRALGNSINVHIVSRLLTILTS